jgi:restriction system protein
VEEREMKPSGQATATTTRWVLWIIAFGALAAPFWPTGFALVCMGLSLFGVLHLAVLIYEQIIEDDINARMSPYEYERYCAAQLEKRRWRTIVTKAAHDQGVDIIATKAGRRIVLQCKKYAKPVGNQAVQQIVAAIAHESAERGVVVATSDFTRAARKLAASNNVLLLHHRDLRDIDRLLARSAR